MKNNLESITYTLPAHWASYLINNDASGINGSDKAQADKFLIENGLPWPVSCSDEAYFDKHPDCGGLPCSVLDYSFLLPVA